MSVWKRELFKWTRSDTTMRDTTSPVQPLVSLGNINPTNLDLKNLHMAAIHGRKKDIITVLQTGFWVDFPNDAGQTALFVATLRGQYRTAEFLLQNGANPNEKSNTGMTPVHVACLKGSLRVLGAMLEAGGDLRLHDNEGKSCLDWASYQPDPRKRMKMMEFLQKSQLFALNYSGDFVGQTSSLERQPSVLQMLRGKISSQMSLDFSQETGLRRVQSYGYGHVYFGGEAGSGIVSVIPLVTENQLRNDTDGITFQSSSNFVYTSMTWNFTPVTVKQIEKRSQRENAVDLLIAEMEQMSKLRHPNILLLMGLCQSNTFDNIMLIFERVSLGSLYNILYEKADHFPMTYIRDIAIQVCQAMLYIQNQNYIHCSLSSHAVFLVSTHQAKVGCLEYMVEMKKASIGRTSVVATSPHKDHLYRWIAPEIMKGNSPCAASDVYSFCCLLREMITSELPWRNKTAEQVLELLQLSNRQLLSIPKSVTLFRDIMELGLKQEPKHRPRDFFKLLRWLQGPLDQPPGWKPSVLDRVKTIQKESNERINLNPKMISMFDLDDNRETSSSETRSYSSSSLTETEQSSRVTSATKSPSIHVKPATSGNDSTNNYYILKSKRLGNTTDSCGAQDNSDDSLDATDDWKMREKQNHEWSVGVHSAADQKLALYQSENLEGLKQKPFHPPSGLSADSRREKYSRRASSLPGQKSLNLLQARRSASPQLCSSGVARDGQTECSDKTTKTLPPVKPASHSTDVKEFVRGEHFSTSSLQTIDIISRNAHLKANKVSMRRSLSPIRNRTLRGAHKLVTKSQSAVCDAMTAAGTDVELSRPGSVRTLTEQFQVHLYNHSLRQSILKGSKSPHGISFDDLDTAPTRLQLSSSTSEIPPEGQLQPSADIPDKEMFTCSVKGSTESLTSVSLRDESTLDEEDGGELPLTDRDELYVTDEGIASQSAAIYAPHSEFHNANSRFLENSSYRLVSSHPAAFDHTDSCPAPRIDSAVSRMQFLPSSTLGTDICNHPFDFQDYYLDDDYTVTSEDGIKQYQPETSHWTTRSRRRTRDHFLLGNIRQREEHGRMKVQLVNDGMTKGQLENDGETKSQQKTNVWMKDQKENAEEKDVESNKGHLWFSRKMRNKDTQTTVNFTTERQRTEDDCSYRKEDQWLEDQWRIEEYRTQIHQKEKEYQQTESIPVSHIEQFIEKEEKTNEQARNETFKVNDELLEDSSQEKEDYRREIRYSDGSSSQKWPSGKIKEHLPKTDRLNAEESWLLIQQQTQHKREHSEVEKEKYRNEHLPPSKSWSPPRDYQREEDQRLQFHHKLEGPVHVVGEDETDKKDVVGYSEDNGDRLSGLWEGSNSRESSLSTVVERRATDSGPQQSEDRADNVDSSTLTESERTAQRRCLLVSLEKSGSYREANEDLRKQKSRPKYSPPQTTLRKIYLDSSTGSQGYTATMRVESSLQKPGCHHITHTACDSSTGITQTVHEETVKAETLRTSMGIQ